MPRVLTPEILEAIESLCQRYPNRLAALLPSLHLVQSHAGYISADAQLDVAEKLGVPATRVREVVSFYTMFNEKPVGKHVVKICRNLPCQMRGADKIMQRAEAILNIKMGETTSDGKITLDHEECLASCGTGPMLWYNDTLVENLTEDSLEAFLGSLT